MIKIIRSNWLEVTGLPLEVEQDLIDDLTFDNPVYKNAVDFGKRPPKGTKRFIKNYRQNKETIFLPRGTEELLKSFCSGYSVETVDKTAVHKPEFPSKQITLRDYQTELVEELQAHNDGIGEAPPGAGKTIAGLELYARYGQPCLWITHTRRLARQTAKRAEEFLGITAGLIGSGKEDVQHFTVGIVQSLIRKDLQDYKDKFGLIIIDECHHASAPTWLTIAHAFSARYRKGLTATPYRSDGLEPLMTQALGPIRYKVSRKRLRDAGVLMTPTVVIRPTNFYFDYDPFMRRKNYAALEKALRLDENRNCLISGDVIVESTYGKNVCIILVKFVAHGKTLHKLLAPVIPKSALVHSSMSDKAVEKVLNDFEAGELDVLIATYKMLAEGFDYPPANRLFLTAAFKDETLIKQATGRIERVTPDKISAIVFDYTDNKVAPLAKQAEQRRRVYKAKGDLIVTSNEDKS